MSFISWWHVELATLLVAFGGVIYGARNLHAVRKDRGSALKYGLPIDRETARANLESEIEKCVVQWGLVGFSALSLAIEPSSDTIAATWARAGGAAVIVKQAVILFFTFQLMWRSRRDRIARHRIMAFEADPEPTTALLERLGGPLAVKRIVAELYARVLRDPALAQYFEGQPLTHLMQAQTDFLTDLFSGRVSATDLRTTHAGLHIPPEDFERFVDLFRETLASFDVPGRLAQRVLEVILSTRDQIVTRTPTP